MYKKFLLCHCIEKNQDVPVMEKPICNYNKLNTEHETPQWVRHGDEIVDLTHWPVRDFNKILEK